MLTKISVLSVGNIIYDFDLVILGCDLTLVFGPVREHLKKISVQEYILVCLYLRLCSSSSTPRGTVDRPFNDRSRL